MTLEELTTSVVVLYALMLIYYGVSDMGGDDGKE